MSVIMPKDRSFAYPGSCSCTPLEKTVTNMRRDDETRWQNLLGEKANLFVGLGYRLTRSLRLGGGFVLFQKNDENPLVDERSLAVTPYVSLSFDVDLVGAFKGW